MSTELKIYECHNPACVVGTRHQPGTFTGGSTAAGRALLTGEPAESLVEGKDYGEGFCPACGDKGKATKGVHVVPPPREDPLEHIHAKARPILARRDDPNDPMTPEEAQEALGPIYAELRAAGGGAGGPLRVSLSGTAEVERGEG